MRLTCPNCDAQYEVPDEVMPISGRDVQCSNCGQTWFQHHPDHEPGESTEPLDLTDPDPDDEIAPPPSPPPLPSTEPARRQLDPAVADILRQEAEAEQAARRAQQPDPLESQPDLGLDDTDTDDDPRDRRSREARERMARLRGDAPPVSDAAATAAAIGSRRELLPDIEEINSTLRSGGAGPRNTATSGPDIQAPTRRKQGRGFRSGFLLVVLIAVVLALFYIYAPQIARAVPQADPLLSGYVTFIDGLRNQLNAWVEDLLLWLETAASRSGS